MARRSIQNRHGFWELPSRSRSAGPQVHGRPAGARDRTEPAPSSRKSGDFSASASDRESSGSARNRSSAAMSLTASSAPTFQPVSAGDGADFRLLAGADDFVKQIGPALHQDQEIAGLHRRPFWKVPRSAPSSGMVTPVIDHLLDRRRNPFGQDHRVVAAAWAVDGARSNRDPRRPPPSRPPATRSTRPGRSDLKALCAARPCGNRRGDCP